MLRNCFHTIVRHFRSNGENYWITEFQFELQKTNLECKHWSRIRIQLQGLVFLIFLIFSLIFLVTFLMTHMDNFGISIIYFLSVCDRKKRQQLLLENRECQKYPWIHYQRFKLRCKLFNWNMKLKLQYPQKTMLLFILSQLLVLIVVCL